MAARSFPRFRTSLQILATLVGTLAGAGLIAEDPARAADAFGQTIPPDLEATVTEGRKLRLPYERPYDPKRSVQLLGDAVKRKPDYYRALFNLALAQAELQDFDKATEAFERALKVRDEQKIADTTIFNSFGWVALTAGRYDRAIELFKTGLEDEAANSAFTNGALYNNLGLAYFYKQDFSSAAPYLTTARDKFGSAAAGETLKLIDAALTLTKAKDGS